MAAKQNRREGQSGEVMLEMAIVFVPVLVLLLALLSLGFWFYQTAMMTSVAEEIAAEVARNIKFENLADHGGTLTVGDVSDLRMFRSTFGFNRIKNAQRARAEAHADWRIPLTSLGFGSQDPEVTLELESSGLGRTHVKVTVRQKTDFFLSGILKYTGIVDDHPVFGGTAYAECVDLMEYSSMVNFLRYGSEKLGTVALFSSIGQLYAEVNRLLRALGIVA